MKNQYPKKLISDKTLSPCPRLSQPLSLTLSLTLALSLSLSLESFAAQEMDYKEAEKMINEAAKDMNPVLATEIVQNNKGEYPRLARQGSLGEIQSAWGKASPGSGVYNVTYSQAEMIRLRVREFTTTVVVLPVWEKIIDIEVGDKSAFEAVQSTDHILFMKPKGFVGVCSNIIVIGQSGYVYNFYIRAEGYNSKYIPDATVNVHVPGGPPQSFPDPRRPGFARDESGSFQGGKDSPSSPDSSNPYPQERNPRWGNLNFLWSMSGKREHRDIAPKQVFSDGIRTWFDFGEKFAELDYPVIARMIDGVDVPVNTRQEGNMIIAESVGVFSLRNGDRKICVYPSNTKKS
jgi:ComB9 competence protein